MSIRTVARFVLKALATSLAKEITKHNREMSKVVTARNSKVAELNADIKALVSSEAARIDAVMAKAQADVARIKGELHVKMDAKHQHIKACEQFCKHSQAKAEKAGAMRSKVLAIVE